MAEFTLSLVDQVTGPAKSMTGSLSDLVKQTQGASGGMGDLTGAAEMAIDPITAIGAAALAAGAAFAAIVIGGAKAALEMSELREKTVAMFNSLGRGENAGEDTIKMLDGMRASLGMTRAELVPFAKDLMSMGIQGDALTSQLTALASTKALMGDQGSQEYLLILKKISGQAKISSKDLVNLKKTGVNVDDMARGMGMSVKQLQAGLKNGTVDAKKFGEQLQKAVTAKGAEALAAQANSLTAQWARFKENLGMLFEGVNIKPFLAGMKDLLGIFDQGTASGKSMKFILTQTFNGVFAIASKVLPYIKTFLLQLVIGALKLYISLKPVIAHFQKLFAGKSDGQALTKMVTMLADAIMLTVSSVAYLVVGVAYFYEFMINAWTTIFGYIGKAINWFKELGASIMQLFSGSESIAGSFVDGLVNGIKNGVGRAVQAAKDLAGSVVDGAKSMLGIHSPSTVMAQLGGHTATGFAQGMTAGADTVAAASSGMASAAVGGAASAGGGGGGGGVNVGDITINVNGGSSPQETADLIEEKLTLVFERLALSQGLGAAA